MFSENPKGGLVDKVKQINNFLTTGSPNSAKLHHENKFKERKQASHNGGTGGE